MGFERGFMEYGRIEPSHEDKASRVKHFNEFIKTLSDEDIKIQAGRCMDCGIPFCSHICPLHNIMPEFNQAMCEGDFDKAYEIIELTNNFPEITGRICPALCEEGCTLGLHRQPVGIKSVERKIADYAIDKGLIKPRLPKKLTGHKVAIVGSGPAALACAQELCRLGHEVSVFEKNDHIGGLLRYGIPDFKLSKTIIDRRLSQMEAEGITFLTKTLVGNPEDLEPGVHSDAVSTIRPQTLMEQFDAVVLCPGSEAPRDLPLPGRDLKGIYFALDFLIAQNRENAGLEPNPIDVKGKKVLVIGGGETASDCIGTSIRKGAREAVQVDYHDELPLQVDPFDSWPYWKKIKRTSTSQEEGCIRLFSTNTTSFEDDGQGRVKGIKTVKITWGPGRKTTPIEGTEDYIDGEVILIAMGYAHPSASLVKAFGLKTDNRGNILAATRGEKAYQTSIPKVFAAGDGRKGQSLVVYALAEGRECARSVHRFLTQRI